MKPENRTAANAAIFFASEAYSTGGARLMGRHAAGEGFLRAWVRHSGADPLWCYAASRREADAFAAMCRSWGGGEVPVNWLPTGGLAGLREPGTLFYPGPQVADLAWQRRRLGASAYSVVGVTHTISSHGATDAVADMLLGPVEPWDALVCTSRAVVDSVRRLLAAEGDYLKERLQATRQPQLNLALIPLGVDCEGQTPDEIARRSWREKLGIGAEDVAFLFFGRLSYHAKANPLPMYLALEHAAQATGRRIHLIQAGWFANEALEEEIRAGARLLCPSVNAIFLDGREPAVRREIWHAADAFVSLVDNVQETFGLTPIEAMAAGLPCVVSDWDGYKDTVRDGIDGFRIATVIPPAGYGADLAARHEDGLDSYDRYIGNASLFVAVDIEASKEACTRLAADAGLRRRMGAAARERALAVFDWPVVIRQYQELWGELAKRRAAAPASKPAMIARSRRADPYWLFADYPSSVLGADSRITATGQDLAERSALHMLNYAGPLLPDARTSAKAVDWLRQNGSATVAELLAQFDAGERPRLLRGLTWLAKLGVLRIG
jgi:starch synthase